MGYHKAEIPRGEYGEYSKIEEEFIEFRDAYLQKSPVLELVELTDLIGAIAGYSEKHFNITLEDLVKMTEATRSSFREGKRK